MRRIGQAGNSVIPALCALLVWSLAAHSGLAQDNEDEQHKHTVSVKQGKKLGEAGGSILRGPGKSLRKSWAPYSERSFANKAPPSPPPRSRFDAVTAAKPAAGKPEIEPILAKLVEAGVKPKWLGKNAKGEYAVNLSECAITDVSFLKGLPIIMLSLKNTKVSDLSPLAEMRLTHLNVENTPVFDLSPLKGMPIVDLRIRGTKVADLSPILELPLEHLELSVGSIKTGLDKLGEIKTLRTVSGDDNVLENAADFVKRISAPPAS